MESGVIQRSVLGPTLFSIFVNSIDEALEYCHILKYADDTRIFCSAKNSDDGVQDMRNKIQTDISNIVSWSSMSGLRLNTDKCFSISFGRSDVQRNYTISDRPIPCKMLFSDLGVVAQSPITFKSHYNQIISKGFSKLSIINKVFKYKNQRNIMKIFKGIVRPSLEYASVIWSPHSQVSVDNIERVRVSCVSTHSSDPQSVV